MMDGEIGGIENERVRLHLSSCGECGEYLAELEKTVENLKQIEDVDPPPWLKDRIMEQVKSEKVRATSLFDRLFRPPSFKVPLEAAAALLVIVTAVFLYRGVINDKDARLPSYNEGRKMASSGKAAPAQERMEIKKRVGGRVDGVEPSPLRSKEGRAYSVLAQRKHIYFLLSVGNLEDSERNILAGLRKIGASLSSRNTTGKSITLFVKVPREKFKELRKILYGEGKLTEKGKITGGSTKIEIRLKLVYTPEKKP
jgi:hypothetical protein